MKKHRISKRIFAMVLVICMVFTMMPANVSAASKGAIVDHGMGMDADTINYEDKITWPIEIYDYYNDGMLFEYASYTGNTASWAELDKNGDYCYMPTLEAEYYADYTTDAIMNTQVVRRWFDVWNTAYTQPRNPETGQKYFTFSNFTGKATELIDFRDPNSDAVIDIYGRTDNTLDSYDFTNAYGYTFVIDDVNGSIAGGDATIITSRDAYIADADVNAAYDCNPYYAANVELKPTNNKNEYEVVKTHIADATYNPVSVDKFTWGEGYIMMLIHGSYGTDKNANKMDRVAAAALKKGDKITFSRAIADGETNILATVGADTNGAKSGTVSKDNVKYAALVYRAAGSATTTASGNLTYSNVVGSVPTDWTQIYAYTSATATDTPSGVAGVDDGTAFNWCKGIVLECTDSTNNIWKVIDCDLDEDGANKPGWTAFDDNKMILIFRHEAESGTYADSYNFFMNHAKVGAEFTLKGTTLSSLQTVAGSLSGVTLSCEVPVEETGEMSAFFRAPGSETPIYCTSKTVPLSGVDIGSDWRYCVFDLSNVDVSEIQSAGISLESTSLGNTYDLLVSHFALFGTEADAEMYGEKALVYNKHYIQTLYPDNAVYSADYTTSEIANATTLETWFATNIAGVGHSWGKETDATSGRQNYVFTFATATDSAYQYNDVELIDFTSIGGVDRNKLQHAVLVAYSEYAANNDIQIYFRDKEGKQYFCDHVRNMGGWTKDANGNALYSSLDFKLGDDLTIEKVYSAGIRITGYYYDDAGAKTMDNEGPLKVRQFAFFDNEKDKNDYAAQIAVYNQYSGVPTSYYNPIYDNMGYGLLTVTRENVALYDKYENRIGYDKNAESNDNAYATLEDMIYLLSCEADKGEELDLSTYDFDGYKLQATLTDGSFTGGLLEGALSKDGNPVYREQVIDYLAQLLATTLVIPEYEGGYFNYDFVRGEASADYADANGNSRDLAAAIRSRVGIDFNQKKTDVGVNDEVTINDTEYTITYGAKETTNTISLETIGFDKSNPVVTINGKSYTVTNPDAIAGEYPAGVLAALIKGQSLIGKWSDCEEYIENCHDAAYFLLNNLFEENSYNEPQDTYDYLVLNKATITTGDETKEAYVFDAGLTTENQTSALKYENGMIYYLDAKAKHLYHTANDTVDENGNTVSSTTTLFPFLPVRDKNTEEGMTKSPYFADPGVSYNGTYGETYYERDFNYVMKSSGEFVYHEDDGLFFEFEGDDDVYLFINGQLVLDIGGAHSITKERIDINDYVEAARAGTAGTAGTADGDARNAALNLQEGGVYSFDFFYMERHGYGANCRIATNMRVTDPDLRVNKTAYRDSEEIEYGGIVIENEKIEYNFALENTGNTKLYDITFDDPFIGVAIDSTNGLTTYIVKEDGTRDYDANRDGKADNTGIAIPVFDKTGASLDATDITAVVTGYKKVTEGTGDYVRDEATLKMSPQEGGNYIYTLNEVKFADTTVTDDNGNEKVIDANQALKNFMATLEDGAGGLEDDNDNAASGTVSTTGGGGLWVNSILTIKGIYYTLTAEQINKGYFDNTVYATATTESKEVLRGQDNHRVYVPSDPYYYQWADEDIIITKERLVEDVLANAKGETDPFYGKVEGLKEDASNVSTIKEVSYTGREISTSTVTIDSTTNNVKVAYPDAGTKVFYLKVYYTNNGTETSVMVPVVVYVTDVEDSYVVLDYGLSVDLTDEVFRNDTVTIPGHDDAKEHLMGVASGNTTPSYSSSAINEDGENEVGLHKIAFATASDGVIKAADGTFKLDGDTHEKTLTYAPEDFMDDMDSIWAAVSVHEAASGDFTPAVLGGEINIGKEVQMYEKVSVLPANVVYYEDDFPAVKYVDAEGNIFTPTRDGSGEDETQSADQDQEYGRDDAYRTDSDMSGNSLTKITINASGEVAYFDFKGTGFELISRTNATDSAKLSVKVKEILSYDANGNADVGTTNVMNIPVDTEFDHNGDGKGNEVINQVPVIRVNDLEYGTYRVYISGVPARYYGKVTVEVKDSEGNVMKDPEGNVITEEVYADKEDNPTADGKPYIIPTTLYIDGFRIFQPLAEITETTTTDEEGNNVTETVVTPGKNEHYNDSENGAIFEEIRHLIQNGQAAIVGYDKVNLDVSTGTVTWTENRNNTNYDASTVFEGNRVTSINDYLAFGPNNEVYMEKEETTDTALVFYVEEASGDVHNLQIAFRAIDQDKFYGRDTTKGTIGKISYGVDVEGKLYWTESITTKTATEQYYTIDYTKCPYVEGKGYQIAIKVDEGMISYTSLKYNGLTIKNMDGETEGEAPTLTYVNGILTENSSGEAVNGEIYPAFSELRLQFIAEDIIGFDAINGIEDEFQPILYQTREDKDVRLIAHVVDLNLYESVSFTLTIDGKESKDLVCTTAYSGLYAIDDEGKATLYDTGKVYGEAYADHYFVTYTINNYLEYYRGKEVTITVTYKSSTGEVTTKSRTVKIGTAPETTTPEETE